MTSMTGGSTDPELDFWSFVEVAVARAGAAGAAIDPEAMRLVIGLHRVSSMIVYDLESTVHRPSGWSWAGFRLLFVLWVTGRQDASTAAHLCGMSRPAVSALVKTLARAGLLTRTTAEHDRRVALLELSPAGREKLAGAFHRHHERERLWASALEPAEQAELSRLLAKLSAGAEARRIRRRL